MKKFLALATILICASCASWHCKKCRQFARINRDTVFIWDTVFIPRVEFDTLFIAQVGDTIIRYKDRAKMIYVKLPGDSVYIQCQCDSVMVETRVPVYVKEEVSVGYTTVQAIGGGAVIGAITFLLGRVTKRRRADG